MRSASTAAAPASVHSAGLPMPRWGADGAVPPALATVTAPSAPHRGIGRPALWTLAGAAAVLALLIVSLGVGWKAYVADRSRHQFDARDAAPRRLSIVVMPFADANGQAGNLASLLTEEVTTGLSDVRGSFVVSPSMARAVVARKLPLPEMGRELGVRYVLEGSLRPSAKGVELRAQLSDTATGGSVWTSRFEAAAGAAADLSTELAQSLM